MVEAAALRAVRGCLAAFPREARGERGEGGPGPGAGRARLWRERRALGPGPGSAASPRALRGPLPALWEGKIRSPAGSACRVGRSSRKWHLRGLKGSIQAPTLFSAECFQGEAAAEGPMQEENQTRGKRPF